MKVIYYQRPNAKQTEMHITEVNEADAKWFADRNVTVSMEDDMIPDCFICYANWGAKDDVGEPVEAIEFSMHRSCRETLTRLRDLTESMMRTYPNDSVSENL